MKLQIRPKVPMMLTILHRLSIYLIALLPFAFTPGHSEIVIGVPYPETGNDKNLGWPVREGIEFAVEYINNKYNLLEKKQKLVVEWKDDKCESSQARIAANELIKLVKPVQVVIGHNCSGAALAGAPIYNSRQLIMISTFATNPDLTEKGYNF